MNYNKRKIDKTDFLENINSKFLKLSMTNNKGPYIGEKLFKNELRSSRAYEPQYNPTNTTKKLSDLISKLNKLKLSNMKDQATQTDLSFDKCVHNKLIKYQGSLEEFYKGLIEKNTQVKQINNVAIS